MRFVTTPKRTATSVTTDTPTRNKRLVQTKGWYTNRFGKQTHHPKKKESPTTFVGVDGEGVTDAAGVHRYVLLGVGDKQIENPDGITWDEAFRFLYSQFKPGRAYVGFFLGYDFTQIFKTLPEDTAWMLLSAGGRALRKHRIPGKPTHPVQCGKWQFDILGMKRLRIRPKDCECVNATCPCDHKPWMYICDVGSFFQTSFLKVIDPKGWPDDTAIVTAEEYADICTGKDKRSTAVLDGDMRRYNKLENDVLARVMRTLENGLHAFGVHLSPSQWFGPGQAAQEWLKTQPNVPTNQDIQDEVPDWFLEAARMSYFGGWFEIFMHGHIPGESHEYDINSAYPSVIAKLPCLLHGTYTHGSGLPPTVGPETLTLVYGRVWSPTMPLSRRSQRIGAMLHRDRDGRILRPKATEGWFWYHELEAAARAGCIKPLTNDDPNGQYISKWVRYEPCDCPNPMEEIANLYQKRLEVGKKTPMGKAAKLVYNSAYGKFAQSVGSPMFSNPIYASLITSGCRTQILDAIASHPGGKESVAMVATDAVFFTASHPKLRISESLGDWDYQKRTDLTLFKPGVYWDDDARRRIAAGGSPSFKTRGFKASDFATHIERVDEEFRKWDIANTIRGSLDAAWPTVKFPMQFCMVTAIQALQRNDWELAGTLITGNEVSQNADPSDKRTRLFRHTLSDGRSVYRSEPYDGIAWDDSLLGSEYKWIASQPYERRFGLEDPWSDEYAAQYGETPDGTPTDLLTWVLMGD